MKSHLKLIYGVILGLFLALSIGLAFVFTFVNNGQFFHFASNDHGNLIIYIIIKSIVSLTLVVMGIIHLTSHRQEGITYLQLIMTLSVQFIPLINRGLGQIVVYNVETVNWVWGLNLAISLLILFAYFVFILLTSLSSKRFLKVKESVKPESEKEVQRNKDLAINENGDFVGPKK